MEDFEKQVQIIQKVNTFILARFQTYLNDKKLSKSTINKHVENIDFFINDYLLRYEPTPAKEGSSHIGFFLGNWFIRKAMWASVTSIKENITSMKKFYQFMYENGEIEKYDIVELKEEIKNCKEEWFENIRMYDNPNIDLDDIW
jgi:site-specific recombinase XerD